MGELSFGPLVVGLVAQACGIGAGETLPRFIFAPEPDECVDCGAFRKQHIRVMLTLEFS